MREPCVFDAPKCTRVLERTEKKCGVRIIFRNLCLNISENACNRAFLTSRSVRRYSSGQQKSAVCVLSLETFAKYFRECVQPCVFDAPKRTKVLERTAKKCGVRVIFRNLCLNISENACSRAFLTPRSVQGYSRVRQKSAGCVLSLETFA